MSLGRKEKLHLKLMQRYFLEVVKRTREFPPFQINERRVYQFRGLFERWVARSGRREIRLLFYPDLPHPKSAVNKICYLNGYDTTNDPSQKCDLAIHWRDETLRETDSVLDAIAKQTRVINYACRDISKKHVDAVFREIFGYSVMIDPRTHRGPCVVKSDLNALHDGKIMMCPAKGVRQDCVYQKVINNAVGENAVQDIRVPVFRNRIPFVYLKDRPAEERIRFRKFNKAKMVPVSSVISGDEKEKILAFTEKFGLDYGEVDVLRDNGDGRLYIIDVNNTPFGPPKHLRPDQCWQALKIMGRYFGEVFINGK